MIFFIVSVFHSIFLHFITARLVAIITLLLHVHVHVHQLMHTGMSGKNLCYNLIYEDGNAKKIAVKEIDRFQLDLKALSGFTLCSVFTWSGQSLNAIDKTATCCVLPCYRMVTLDVAPAPLLLDSIVYVNFQYNEIIVLELIEATRICSTML